MPEYRIFETGRFQRDLRRLARSRERTVVKRLMSVVHPQLKRHPHFGPNIRKLKEYEPETWRHRIGAWRFFYETDEAERVVLMIAASHRIADD